MLDWCALCLCTLLFTGMKFVCISSFVVLGFKLSLFCIGVTVHFLLE